MNREEVSYEVYSGEGIVNIKGNIKLFFFVKLEKINLKWNLILN
jgi:hypothetical protein